MAWFDRQEARYWKLFHGDTTEKVAQFWPRKEDGTPGPETQENAADALRTELRELDPGRYTLKAYVSPEGKDNSQIFKHRILVTARAGAPMDPVSGTPAPRGMGFTETGIFGHPDVQAHIRMVRESAEQDKKLALLEQRIDLQAKANAETPPGPLEAAVASLIQGLAPFAPAIIQAVTGAPAAPPVAGPPAGLPAPGGTPDAEEANLEKAVETFKRLDPDYHAKLLQLAQYGARNPEGFKTLLGNIDMLTN
jgi:hypothetical protein